MGDENDSYTPKVTTPTGIDTKGYRPLFRHTAQQQRSISFFFALTVSIHRHTWLLLLFSLCNGMNEWKMFHGLARTAAASQTGQVVALLLFFCEIQDSQWA
jgi:hypothetical protein